MACVFFSSRTRLQISYVIIRSKIHTCKNADVFTMLNWLDILRIVNFHVAGNAFHDVELLLIKITALIVNDIKMAARIDIILGDMQ